MTKTKTETVSRYKMVVGIDFQRTGDDALAEALRLAHQHRLAELHLVHVVDAGNSPRARKIDELADRMEEAGKSLRARAIEVSERLFPHEQWELDMVFHVRLGDAARAIDQVAVDYDADLIVVGTHARTGLGKLVLGSVAQELMLEAHVPVLVARERDLSRAAKSDSKPEAPRAGDVLTGDSYQVSERVSFGRGGRHISGLI